MSEIELQNRRRHRRKTLTDKMVAELPRRSGQTYYFPDPELIKFGVRVRPIGPGTYTVITRNPFGKQRWIKIGSTGELTIAQAREKAREVIRRIEAGLDPFEAPKVEPDSVRAVVENWLKRHVEKKKLRTAGEMRRIVNKYIIPHVGKLNFVNLRRKQIAELLDFVEDEHGPAQADAVLAVLRSVATFEQSRNEDYEVPFVKNMKRVPKQDRERDRVLNDDELRAVWRHAEGAGAFGALVRLLSLTGQRLDKVRDLKWDDITAQGVWVIRTLPREKPNAGALQLPDIALQIINAQPRFATNPYIFAGQGNGRRAFDSHDKANFNAACGVSGWRLHDLRRTARSLMSRAGVSSEIGEKVLGHTVGAIERTYDRHSYDDEKAKALRKLAAQIEMIVNPPEGDNVVQLHEASGNT